MKKSKIMITIMVALIIVFFSGNVFAQTTNENHAKLTTDHQTIMKYANIIASGEAKTLNEQIINYNEARKSLADAKKVHSLLKKVIPEKLKSEAIIHHDNIDKYHASATNHANSLAAELKNSNSDIAKLKEYAKKFSDAANMAEKEHKELMKDEK